MAEDASQISVEDFDRQMMAGYAEPSASAEPSGNAAPVGSQPATISLAGAGPVTQEPTGTPLTVSVPPVGDASPAAVAPTPSQAQQPAAAPEDPSGLRPDIAKNFRITANDAIEQRALQIRAGDRGLSLSEALNKAYEEIGVANPALNRQATQAMMQQQQVQAEPVVTIDSRIAALEAEQEKLNPALDAEEYHRLNKEIRALEREQVRLEAQQVASEQLNEIQGQQSLQQIEATLRSEFDVLSDPSHPFTIAYEAQKQQVYANGTDEQLEDPNLELTIARSLADKFQKSYGMTVGKQVSRPVAQPQAQQANVTQQPGVAAVAAQAPAAQPRSAAAPLSTSSASAIPVMGVREADPGSAAAALLSNGKGVGEDFDALLMGSAFQGGNVPAPGRSYSMGG